MSIDPAGGDLESLDQLERIALEYMAIDKGFSGGFQVMPFLDEDQMASLMKSIEERGIVTPIVRTPDGRIIDGHHRAWAAAKLLIPCPSVVVEGTEAEFRSLAYSLNLDRRHLDRKQRRELIAQSLKADPQLSDREHARRTGASDKTVTAIRKPLEESAEIPHFSERVDPRTGNATQPATKTLRVVPRSPEAEPEPEPEPPEPEPERMPSQSRVTSWSEQIQTISATLPIDDLSNEQVEWLWGAVTFLYDAMVSEMKGRGITNEHEHWAPTRPKQ